MGPGCVSYLYEVGLLNILSGKHKEYNPENINKCIILSIAIIFFFILFIYFLVIRDNFFKISYVSQASLQQITGYNSENSLIFFFSGNNFG